MNHEPTKEEIKRLEDFQRAEAAFKEWWQDAGDDKYDMMFVRAIFLDAYILGLNDQ